MKPLGLVPLKLVPRTEPADDGELIAACIDGDKQAQRTLFRREYARVHATVYRILGNTRDVDDLVQETFIAVFRALTTFRGDARLSTWIDRIAVRSVFHHLRTKKATRTVALDAIPELGDVDGGGRVDDQAQARDGLRRLYAALAKLTPEARAAYALYAIDGRSINEVAEITGSTKIVAKTRIWRARREVERRAAADPVLAELLELGRASPHCTDTKPGDTE
jgi:RNA polymerase sigma-70 factor (ECF subfamily)